MNVVKRSASSVLRMVSSSKIRFALLMTTIMLSMHHKQLDSGRFQYNDLVHLMHTQFYLVRKTMQTIYKWVLGQRDHHYWGVLDEIIIRTLGYAARIGHCTAPRKPIEAYAGVQRLTSKVLGHCHVSDIDLGLGRGIEDAVYISLDKKQVLGSIPVVLFFHGGGYCMGTSDMYINAQYVWLKRMLNEHNTHCAILSINYPLAPEVKYPENLHFAFSAYDAILSRGICPSQVIISGDSAGGAMAMQVAKHAAERRVESENAHPALAGLVLISPWVAHSTEAESHKEHLHTDFIAGPEVIGDYTKAYAPEEHHDPLANPSISPLHEDDFDFLPPVMVTLGTREVFRDDIFAFVEKLKVHQRAVRVSVGEDCPHIFPLLWPLIQDKTQGALHEIGEFCAHRLKARQENLDSCPWSDRLTTSI